MSTNLVLEEKQHYYPFLADYAFRDGVFVPKILWQLFSEYFPQHFKKETEKKGNTIELFESLTKKFVLGCEGKDIFGTGSSLTAVRSGLQDGEDVSLHIVLTNITLRLKRFGTCLGIKVTDSHGDTHKDATEIFEKMAALGRWQGGSDHLGQFIGTRSVSMPRWQVYGNDTIDVTAELASCARYVPDVVWRTDAEVVAIELLENYITTNHEYGDSDGGVEVGRYHGIPVYAQILFGEKGADQVWRKGACARDKATLMFDSCQRSISLDMRYIIRIADKSNMFNKAEIEIDYAQEQRCHKLLAKILADAFSARDLAETITKNPHWVKWREEESASEAMPVVTS